MTRWGPTLQPKCGRGVPLCVFPETYTMIGPTEWKCPVTTPAQSKRMEEQLLRRHHKMEQQLMKQKINNHSAPPLACLGRSRSSQDEPRRYTKDYFCKCQFGVVEYAAGMALNASTAKDNSVLARYMRHQMMVDASMKNLYGIDFYSTHGMPEETLSGASSVRFLRKLLGPKDKLTKKELDTLQTYLKRLLSLSPVKVTEQLDLCYLAGGLSIEQLLMLRETICDLMPNTAHPDTVNAISLFYRRLVGELPNYRFDMKSLRDQEVLQLMLSLRDPKPNKQSIRVLEAIFWHLSSLGIVLAEKFIKGLLRKGVLSGDDVSQLADYVKHIQSSLQPAKAKQLVVMLRGLIGKKWKTSARLHLRHSEVETLRNITANRLEVQLAPLQRRFLLKLVERLLEVTPTEQREFFEHLADLNQLDTERLRRLQPLILEFQEFNERELKSLHDIIEKVVEGKRSLLTKKELDTLSELLKSAYTALSDEEKRLVRAFLTSIKDLRGPELKCYLKKFIDQYSLSEGSLIRLRYFLQHVLLDAPWPTRKKLTDALTYEISRILPTPKEIANLKKILNELDKPMDLHNACFMHSLVQRFNKMTDEQLAKYITTLLTTNQLEPVHIQSVDTFLAQNYGDEFKSRLRGIHAKWQQAMLTAGQALLKTKADGGVDNSRAPWVNVSSLPAAARTMSHEPHSTGGRGHKLPNLGLPKSKSSKKKQRNKLTCSRACRASPASKRKQQALKVKQAFAFGVPHCA